MTRAEVVAILTAAGNRPETCALYADAFMEYHAAQENIERNGSIVADPRTAAPIQNPYIPVRDKAFARLVKLQAERAKVSALWEWVGSAAAKAGKQKARAGKK